MPLSMYLVLFGILLRWWRPWRKASSNCLVHARHLSVRPSVCLSRSFVKLMRSRPACVSALMARSSSASLPVSEHLVVRKNSSWKWPAVSYKFIACRRGSLTHAQYYRPTAVSLQQMWSFSLKSWIQLRRLLLPLYFYYSTTMIWRRLWSR